MTSKFQQSAIAAHPAQKSRLIGKGGNSNSPPFSKKPSFERSKSAPPGAGVLEESEIVTKFYVFDFDHTLADTLDRVLVKDNQGNTIRKLDQGELDTYQQKLGESLDFNAFDDVEQDTQEIPTIVNILKNVIEKQKSEPTRIISIVTMRPETAKTSLQEWLTNHGIDLNVCEVVTTNGTSKTAYVSKILKSNKNIDGVEFFDDSLKNINQIRELAKEFPNVKFVFRQPSKDGISRIKVRIIKKETK